MKNLFKFTVIFMVLFMPVAIWAQTATSFSVRDTKGRNARIYTINRENSTMPVFARIPMTVNSVTLDLAKDGQKSFNIKLDNTVDGWMIGEYLFTLSGTPAGLALDFTTGRGYVIPRELAVQVTDTLVAADRLRIRGVTSEQVAEGDLGLVLLDAAVLRPEELNRYPMIINPNAGRTRPVTQTSVAPRVFDNANPRGVMVRGRPLITAAANGQTDLVTRLLDTGSNINETDPETGNNALMESLRSSDENMAANLLRLGIDVRHSNRSGQNPLHIAAEMGLFDSVQRLISAGANINQKDNNGNTVLMYAAVSPNPYLIDILVKRGAGVNDINNNKESAIFFSAYNGNTRSVRALLQSGANPNMTNSYGSTVLMEAVKGGNAEIVRELLANKVDVNAVDSGNNSSLHLAAAAGRTGIGNQLLEAGADVNKRNNAGKTPLMLAAAGKNAPLAESILARNPDMNARDNLGQTALDMSGDDPATRRLLTNKVHNIQTVTSALFESVARNNLEGAKNQIDSGAQINNPDRDTGNTPLFAAVANNYRDMMSLLINNGADVNWQNRRGNTPLILSVSTGDERTLAILLTAGANADLQNENGDTALIWATKLQRFDIVRALLIAGANPNIRNYSGASPLAIALGENMTELEKILRSFGAF